MGSQRVGHDWAAFTFAFMQIGYQYSFKEVCPLESLRKGSPGGMATMHTLRLTEKSFHKMKGSVVSDCLQPHGLYSPWNSPGQNTGVGSLSLLQGIFPTQELNPGLSHCRQILYQLSHKGSPRILEWIAYPFSSGSSQPRNQTGVSCIAGGFFTNWALREWRFHLSQNQERASDVNLDLSRGSQICKFMP